MFFTSFNFFRQLSRSFVGSVFGEEFLSPLKKAPAPKNATATEGLETGTGTGTGEEKKSKKDIAEEKKAEKDSGAPKNAQNAHEAIRPSETDGKVSGI